MAAGWIALIGALAGAASSASESKKKEDRAKDTVAGVKDLSDGDWNGYSAADIFGSKTQPALFENGQYNPIDYTGVQGDTIRGNTTNLPDIVGLTSGINQALRDDSALRIEQFAPGFGGNLRTMTDAAKSLLGGRLPYSDVLDIVSGRQEFGNTIGTAGTFTNATLKDLGISQLQAVQTGSEMMSRITNLVESIDPVGQRSRPQDWTLSPSQTVPLRQQDNQFAASFDQMERILAQQSEQNANVLNSAPDPAARGTFSADFTARTGTPLESSALSSINWGSLIQDMYSGYRYSQQNQGGSTYSSGGGQAAQRYNPDSEWSWNTTTQYPPDGWESPNYNPSEAPYSY